MLEVLTEDTPLEMATSEEVEAIKLLTDESERPDDVVLDIAVSEETIVTELADETVATELVDKTVATELVDETVSVVAIDTPVLIVLGHLPNDSSLHRNKIALFASPNPDTVDNPRIIYLMFSPSLLCLPPGS